MAKVKEATLSVDNFNQPKVLINEKATGTHIMRLILMEKGTIQTHPDMGVGIRSRYRHAEATKLSSLRQDIQNQIESYLPISYESIEVNCRIVSGIIVIDVIADDVLFRFTYDQSNDIFKLSEI